MSYEGVLKARGMMMGVNHNCTVSDDGVCNFPLGNPTFTSAQSYPLLGDTVYSSTSGLGVSSSTTPSEAVSKIDSWLSTYLLDAPPVLSSGVSDCAVEHILVSWLNPLQKKLAFGSVYVPQISHIKADVVPSASNVSHDWASASAWTITLESPGTIPSVTSLKIVLDYASGTSNLSNGVYSYYGASASTRIVQQTSYDVRVYADNEAVTSGARSPRYLYFYDLATLPPGPPGAPSGLGVTTSGVASWTIPSDLDVNSDATPYISQYQVNVSALNSVRYGGALTNHTTPQQTAVAAGGQNAATSLSLTTLNPGTTYSATVQAKNTLNANYGSASSAATWTSSLPSAPSWASPTITLAQPTTASGYTLDGSSSRTIVNYNTIVGGTLPQTSQITTRTNVGLGTTAENIGTIDAIAGATGSESTSTVTMVGFGNAFTSPQSVDNGSCRLRVVSEGDNGSGGTSGFYKKATVYAEAISPATYYTSSDTPYTMKMVFTPTGGSVVTTNTLQFYVDNLNVAPSVVAAGITGATSTTTYVTGVPTFTSASTFYFQSTLSNLAYRFLRSDKKHFDAQVETSAGTNVSTTLSVTKASIANPHYYYDAPAESYATSTNLHNTSGLTLSVGAGNIQFNTFSVSLTGASQLYNEALQLRVTPYNLIGSGTASVVSGRVSPSDGTSSAVRIDTKSVYTLGALSGVLMNPGSGDFPSTGYTSSYDHSISLVDNEGLQMVNGQWVTYGNGSGSGYKNYASYYFPGSVQQPNYTSLTSGTRYVCLRFQNLKGSGTYDTVTITFTSSGLTLTPASDSANFSLHVKVVSTLTTPWVSCTKAISGSGWDAISTDGQGIMDNSSSSIGSIKCFVPTGTPANATIYVRFGLTMNGSSVYSLSNVNCVAN